MIKMRYACAAALLTGVAAPAFAQPISVKLIPEPERLTVEVRDKTFTRVGSIRPAELDLELNVVHNNVATGHA